MMTTADNLKKLREKLGMNQKEFAEAIHVSQTMVSKYEATNDKNPKRPSPDVAYRIVDLANSRGSTITIEYVLPRSRGESSPKQLTKKRRSA